MSNSRVLLTEAMLCECQLMVIGTNSMSGGIPDLGCGEEGNLAQCKHLSCDTAQLLGSHGVRQPQGQPLSL